MSALEMTANGEKISGGAAKKIDEAISQLLEAQRLIADLQREQFIPHGDRTVDAGAVWHRLESIDDRLHDALSRLGD